MTDEQSLLSIYNKMVSSNEIEKNKSQEMLVFELEALKKQLENSKELKKTTTGRIFSNLFTTKPLKEKKGIYIHGGVGIGKSMLMDLFFYLLLVE